jgi:ppGpp synthetase/RelA/SpoT-type nucleotidyltranferase
VEQKIYEYWRGRAELDLWDLVRFRIVAVNIHGVWCLGVAMRELFGERVVRARNFYTRPKGPDDPYRAVHFEIDLGTQGEPAYVEVQILTLNRDAVGLIDHGVIYKHAVACHEALDEEWLRSLSYAANIVDARVN